MSVPPPTYLTLEEREIFNELRSLDIHIPQEFISWRLFFRSHASYMMEFRRFRTHYLRTPLMNFKIITDYSTEKRAEQPKRIVEDDNDYEDWQEYFMNQSFGASSRNRKWPYINSPKTLAIKEPEGLSAEEHTAF